MISAQLMRGRGILDTDPAETRRLWRPSPHLIVMAIVFAGALAVGYLLLPDDNERIAMLERDGHDRQALGMLEDRFRNGDRNQRTLYQLQRLYEEQGDLPKARQMLVLLAAARPRDANVQRNLAEFYRVTQDPVGYIQALEARLARRYSQLVCKELIGLYRRDGNYEAEQRTIASCRIRGYRRPEDIVRLAHLVAADGNMVEAATLLRSVDNRRRLNADEDRLMLFIALLDAGAAEDAKQRATRWFKGARNNELVLQIIDTLADSQRHDLALDLAREVGKPGDSISLAVAELMLDRDQIVAARSYLHGWLDASRSRDPGIASRMIRAALDAEDPKLAYRAAERYGLANLQQDDLIALAEALSAIGEGKAFQTVHSFIHPNLIRDNPLLAAAVEVGQGQPEPARQLLSRVEVKALDEWRLALWARLMTSTGRQATAEQTLREIAAGVARTPGGIVPNGNPLPKVPPQTQRQSPGVEVKGPPPLERPGANPPGDTAAGPGPTSPAAAPPRKTRPPRVVKQRRTTKRRTTKDRRRTPPVVPKTPSPPTPKNYPSPIPFPSPG